MQTLTTRSARCFNLTYEVEIDIRQSVRWRYIDGAEFEFKLLNSLKEYQLEVIPRKIKSVVLTYKKPVPADMNINVDISFSTFG